MKPSSEYEAADAAVRDRIADEMRAAEPAVQALIASLQAFTRELEEEHREP